MFRLVGVVHSPLKSATVPRRRRHLPARFGPLQQVKKVCKIYERKQCQCFKLSGHSVYLNPIEDLWFIIKSPLLKKDCTTKRKLTETVIDVWHRDEEIAKKSKS